MEVALASDRRSLVWLRDWADNWLVDRLSAVGTAGAEVVGGLKGIRVHLDPQRMIAYSLSPARVAEALRDEIAPDLCRPGHGGDEEIIARTMGEFEVEEIRNVALARGANGELVYVRDVAAVEVLRGNAG